MLERMGKKKIELDRKEQQYQHKHPKPHTSRVQKMA